MLRPYIQIQSVKKSVLNDTKPANPMRGLSFHDVVLAFQRQFPPGSELSYDEFDAWAVKQGLLKEPRNRDKQSDAWLAHLQRRHQLRYNINKAASHPRLIRDGAYPFQVESIGQHKLTVRRCYDAIGQSELGEKFYSLTQTSMQRIRYLMESDDWKNLDKAAQLEVEFQCRFITNFHDRVLYEANMLKNGIQDLQQKLKTLVDAGRIRITNGGIKQFIDEGDDDES